VRTEADWESEGEEGCRSGCGREDYEEGCSVSLSIFYDPKIYEI
jgi:hypothetical protein